MAEFKYWAFLSYSHRDKQWGDWLHKALETYRLPRRLIGKESRDGKVPQRVHPIFRDRDELPASADLGSSINEALGKSRNLIVICSPHAARSRWVGEEIKTYKKLGRDDRILALIVDGEPNASDGKPGFKIEDECFPEAMRYGVARDGTLLPQRTEPIAADVREGKDGKNNAKLKLLAGLLGISYDDIRQRDHERRLRRARAVGAVALYLVLIFAVLLVALFFARQEALNANKKNSQIASRGNVSLARYSKGDGRNAQALARLAQALWLNPENREAHGFTTVMLTQLGWHVPLTGSMRHDNRVNSAQFSPDGQRVVTASRDNTARVWDGASGKPIAERMKHEREVNSARFSPDGQRVVTASRDMTARLWDAAIMTDKDTREDILLLAELAEASGGVALETVAQAENLKSLTPEQVIASREKIAAKFLGSSSKLTPLQRVMKWCVSDRKSRTISPFSQVTVSEWLESRIKEGTIKGLRAALQVDPANARVTAHLGRSLADYALKQGSDPDKARRARGEADFLTSRALTLAPDNEEVKALRDEVVKLLELKTN
jgi:TIR domain-containing protein/WD40 domain-containing protein